MIDHNAERRCPECTSPLPPYEFGRPNRFCSPRCSKRGHRRAWRKKDDYLERAARVEDQIIEDAEDALDARAARARLAQLQAGTVKVVTGADLDARLAALTWTRCASSNVTRGAVLTA